MLATKKMKEKENKKKTNKCPPAAPSSESSH
jgi:hypothetical protein